MCFSSSILILPLTARSRIAAAKARLSKPMCFQIAHHRRRKTFRRRVERDDDAPFRVFANFFPSDEIIDEHQQQSAEAEHQAEIVFQKVEPFCRRGRFRDKTFRPFDDDGEPPNFETMAGSFQNARCPPHSLPCNCRRSRLAGRCKLSNFWRLHPAAKSRSRLRSQS